MNALRAELLKAATTRLLLWFGLGLVGFVTLVVSSHIGSENRFNLATESTQRSVFNAAGVAAVTAVLIGTLLVTSEYNRGTINASLLAVPARGRFVAAKLGAVLLVAAALALLAGLATLVLAELWYAGRGISLDLGTSTLTPLLGAIGASLLAAAIGLGLGSLLRRQTASIVLVFLWLLIGENVINLVHGAARYAPGHVLAAVVTAHASGHPDTLGVWAAVAVGLVYALVLMAAGSLAVVRSDVSSSGD